MELIGLAIVAVVALYAIVIYNGLVKARQMKEEAWSGIDVQLKRRTDLIPNLIETVKGYAAHEKGTLENVVELRNRAQAVPSGDVVKLAWPVPWTPFAPMNTGPLFTQLAGSSGSAPLVRRSWPSRYAGSQDSRVE